MLRLLYSLLTALLLPLMLLRLWWRGRANPAYRQRWSERLGRYAAQPRTRGAIVFHAVSVGEVHAALPLVQAWLQRHPQQRVVVTTTTPTGSERVVQLFGTRVVHVYLPYDLPWCLAGFFRHFDPALVVLLETELWPNLLQQCRERGCPAVLVNARLSAKSQRAYARVGSLTRALLQQLVQVSAQAVADGERFVALGLPRSKLVINGSLKYDQPLQAEKVAAAQQLKAQWGGRPVWIAASTREGEEALVLQAQRLVLAAVPTALLVLVPRHLERFASTRELAGQLGFAVVSHSGGESVEAATQVLVGDTMGDMHFYYSLAAVAFVGGSLVNTGCQNIIEAAALGLPVVTGPSLYNFQAASDDLRKAGAQQVVASVEALAATVVELLSDSERRTTMGAQARAVVATNLGATERTLALLDAYSLSH